MSVPKRFKSNVQLTHRTTTPKVLTRGSTLHLLTKDSIFTYTTKTRTIYGHKLFYFGKK